MNRVDINQKLQILFYYDRFLTVSFSKCSFALQFKLTSHFHRAYNQMGIREAESTGFTPPNRAPIVLCVEERSNIVILLPN